MSAAASVESRFAAAYAEQRAAEGRAHTADELRALPYLHGGPPALVRQWTVRARSFEVFMRRIVAPRLVRARVPVRVLDLGAGNGWLSHRVARAGCEAVAVDLRGDAVDGLGAGARFADEGVPFGRIVASFPHLPLATGRFDVVVFNAALHYATDLGDALREARRVTRRSGTIVVLDSPFYRREVDGERMVSEKHRTAHRAFGARAESLLALPFIEYLTPERLASASAPLGLTWRRHRVRYPLWYELRPLQALLRGRRIPSRFDCWECTAT